MLSCASQWHSDFFAVYPNNSGVPVGNLRLELRIPAAPFRLLTQAPGDTLETPARRYCPCNPDI